MKMQTVTFQTPRSKQPSKVFYSHLYDESGLLAKVNGELTFFADTGAITIVEPAMVNFLTVLGELGIAEAAAFADARRGGYAKIATTRDMERR
jgi:hypothetical protein